MMVGMGLDELAYIGLGANVGAPRASLTHAVAALGVLPGAALAGVSRLYRTRPVGPVAQADFLNAAVGLRVPAGSTPADGAMALLVALKGIERALGRVERERWGPREVDLDLLIFGDHRIHVERDSTARSDDPARPGVQWLDVPHPAASERLFVLAPLADLAPQLTPPGWRSTVQEAGTRALKAEGPDAVTPIARWDRDAAAWVDAAD
jgi:2-amino-4-hydroxy-6-hydroxymethyldihydropteridine diphosphokinase